MVAESSEAFLRDRQSKTNTGSLFNRWVNKRLSINSDSVTLSRNRLFILPTRAGLFYACMLAVMLLFALNYNNSMVFVTTFLLASVAVNDIWRTHQNLLGLKVTLSPPPIALAGGLLEIVLLVESKNRQLRPSVEFSISAGDGNVQKSTLSDQSKTIMQLPAIRRGQLPIPQIRIASTYPLGLFRTWSALRFPQQLVIAPNPAPREVYPLPFSEHGTDSDRYTLVSEEDEFSGLRPYLHGDPIRRIAWRASARSNTLISKQFHNGIQDRIIWLRWQDLPSRDTETRLSILCRWILDAHGMQLLYGLSIPGCELSPRSGSQHLSQCLQALALFKEK